MFELLKYLFVIVIWTITHTGEADKHVLNKPTWTPEGRANRLRSLKPLIMHLKAWYHVKQPLPLKSKAVREYANNMYETKILYSLFMIVKDKA